MLRDEWIFALLKLLHVVFSRGILSPIPIYTRFLSVIFSYTLKHMHTINSN